MLKTVMAKRDGGSSSVGEVLKADFVAWAQLGSLRGHQEQQWSKSTAESAVVNCTPRLEPHPLARLITCSMTWTMSFKSMREYLQSCLSCPPSMYPTLLGLRLVTDITAGRPQPLGMAAQLSAIRQDPRPLVWSKSVAAVGTAALTLALMQGQQQLMAARRLQCKDPQPGPGLAGGGEGAKVAAGLKDSLEHHLEVLTRSCTQQALPFPKERCGLLCTTPASLANLLLSGCAAGRFSLLAHSEPSVNCSSASTPLSSAAGQRVLHQCQELMTAGSQGKVPELLSLRLGVTTSHFIALRLERPAGVRPLLLQLPWPISSGANEPDGLPLGCYSGGQGLESVQLRRKSGQVWLKLRKAEVRLLPAPCCKSPT
ncbi:hypothetical protein HaLaN_08702 [Haematococcus lacustris]|uniref:Uncharacterized protein n=1 Tax=Haematococcus lacustris TaxID=44745 RepID=A0A699YTH6_HAELA|nr:hypothetical protein HaLaN_08702 [Haematococcus lacustris]